VPPALAAGIQQGAFAVVTGRAAAAAFSAQVTALAHSTLKALFIGKMKVVLVILFASCTLGGGAIMGAHWMAGDKATGLVPRFHALADTFHRHLENLQGTWDLISLEKDGQSVATQEVNQQRLVWIIEADQIVMQSSNERSTARYSVDPSENPRRIDLTFTSDPEKQDRTLRGIYARTNGNLRVCYDPKGELQPKEFETAAGRSVLVMTFKKRQ
jgi:uncharacterized protein (TIGR03067 family)